MIYQDGEIEFGTKADNGRVRWCKRYKAPHYTESIDATLSFTPEGWWYEIRPDGATIGPPDSCDECYSKISYANDVATPAIALCIANLRAMKAQDDKAK